MNYQDYIVRDPKICGGAAIVRGTRIPVRTILTSLADGDKVEDILQSFPTLSEETIWAVIAFAASSAKDDLPVLTIPTFA